jgi:Resolvase, N terminal domain
MLKDATWRCFDVLLVWSIDRLGRSVLHVPQAMAELDAAGVALISEQQGIDGTEPFGRAMMQMATVFAELERPMICARIIAGLERVSEHDLMPYRQTCFHSQFPLLSQSLVGAHEVVPTGGTVGGMMGVIDGDTIGGMAGCGIAGRSVELSQTCVWRQMPLVQSLVIRQAARALWA